MPKYRVYFQRTTSIDLYLDVDAATESMAAYKANELTAESDDCLIEVPESYDSNCSPTGEVVDQTDFED